MSNADELLKLKQLLDSGVINKGEFEQQKKKLLSDKAFNPTVINSVQSKQKPKNIGCRMFSKYFFCNYNFCGYNYGNNIDTFSL